MDGLAEREPHGARQMLLAHGHTCTPSTNSRLCSYALMLLLASASSISSDRSSGRPLAKITDCAFCRQQAQTKDS